MKIRSLYDCLNARYPISGDYITCLKGHKLGQGKVHKERIDDNEDGLVFKVCQGCLDFLTTDEDSGKIEEEGEINA